MLQQQSAIPALEKKAEKAQEGIWVEQIKKNCKLMCVVIDCKLKQAL